MCRCSALFVVGVLVLVVASLACAVGFAAPFWMLYSDDWMNLRNMGEKILQGLTVGKIFWTEGLWAICYTDKKCDWYFENEFRAEKQLPDWHKAAQGLYGVGLLLLIVGLLVGLIQMCCCFCCKESTSVNSTLGSLCISGAVLVTSGIGVWGGYISQESKFSYISFYWAFFVAIGGVAAAIVAGILFFCESCRAQSYTGYHMTRVV